MSLTSYVIPGLIIGYLAWQWRPILKARHQRGLTAPSLEGFFEGRIQHTAAVYFWSQHCVMCRGMTPIIQRIAEESRDVISLDAEKEVALAKKLGVMATPALVLIQGDLIARIVIGAQTESRIRRLLDANRKGSAP